MKLVTMIRSTLAATCCALMSLGAVAAGLIQPDVAGAKAPALEQQHVEVSAEAGFAITRVSQVFSNPNSQTIDAHYRFPLPEQAAVSGFEARYGDVHIIGEVLEKQQARQLYQQEKSAGREAAITEKEGNQDFQMQVANIPANSQVAVEFSYIEPLVVDGGFGRYVYPLASGGQAAEEMRFWSVDDQVQQRFDFNFDLRSAYPVQAMRLPAHAQASITQHSPQQWTATFSNSSTTAAGPSDFPEEEQALAQPAASTAPIRLDQDVVVYWRLQSGQPGSLDFIAHQPEGEAKGTFMLTLTPAMDLQPVSSGRDWVFVVDESGSMSDQLGQLSSGIATAIERLPDGDRVRVVTFSDQAREKTSGWVTLDDNRRSRLANAINFSTGGSTNLFDGVTLGFKIADSDRPTAVVVVSDGVANEGETELKRFISLMKSHDLRVFTFIMGNNSNAELLSGMARLSNGFSVAVSTEDDVQGRLLEAESKLAHQSLRDLELSIDGIRVEQISPADIRSLYQGQQLRVFGRYVDDGDANGEIAVTLSGRVGADPREWSTRFSVNDRSSFPEIERLWAYARILDLEFENELLGDSDDRAKQAQHLAVKYGLVTDRTSMVAVRDDAFSAANVSLNTRERNLREQAARQQRRASSQPVQAADKSAPMFGNSTQPSHSGGGAIGIELLLLMVIGLVALITAKRRHA